MTKKISFFFLLLAFFLFASQKIEAAYLRFDPNSVNSSSGNSFDVKVVLEPGNDQVYSADIYVIYDSSLLKVTNVKAESLFSTVSHDESTSGKIYIAAMVNDPTQSISTAGAVTTITFQALKDGSEELSFDCANSKIIKNDANATNVLNCSQNTKSSITIGVGNTTTNTTNTTNTSPETLPKTGIFENVVKFSIPGAILLLIGGLLRLVV